MILMSVSSLLTNKNCISLKNQECNVRKVIVDNYYMTFPYKIKVERCVGSCNDANNPYSKVCFRDSVKNISAKVFNLISQQNELKNIKIHKSCKCDCLLNKTVCNKGQKWHKNKCRCECLKIKECGNNFF